MKGLFILAGLAGVYYIYRNYNAGAAGAASLLPNSPTLVPNNGITAFSANAMSVNSPGASIYPINYQATGPITNTTLPDTTTPLNAPYTASPDTTVVFGPGTINGLRCML